MRALLLAAMVASACALEEPQVAAPIPAPVGVPPPGAKNKPPAALAGDAVSRPMPHLSDLTKIRNNGRTVEWQAKMCVDTDGRVASISVLKTFVGADPDIDNVVRVWTFRPQPEPICTLVRFVFKIGG